MPLEHLPAREEGLPDGVRGLSIKAWGRCLAGRLANAMRMREGGIVFEVWSWRVGDGRYLGPRALLLPARTCGLSAHSGPWQFVSGSRAVLHPRGRAGERGAGVLWRVSGVLSARTGRRSPRARMRVYLLQQKSKRCVVGGGSVERLWRLAPVCQRNGAGPASWSLNM